MIRRLRITFVIIAVCSFTVVLAVIMGVINLVSYNRIDANASRVLGILAENEGSFPLTLRDERLMEDRPLDERLLDDAPREERPLDDRPPMEKFRPLPPETPYETRFFTALFGDDGQIVALNTRSIAAITADEAVEYAFRAREGSRESGYDGVYKYLTTETARGTLIVFLDCTRDLTAFRSFLMISIVVSAIGIAAVFAILVVLSKVAVKPVAESYEKQRQFITDASHEIKTPLTIIAANTEVLEISGGENEWTESIKKQVRRMSDLTAGLITLSRMDEQSRALVTMDFSLSDAVVDGIEPFLALAAMRNKAFNCDIQGSISYDGNEESIRQLVSILADNAIKHSSERSTIQVTLKKRGRYNELVFSNRVDSINKGNLNVIFERFYRGDSSRSSTVGGYGIGLSIAKAIVTAHRGRIRAESPDGKSIAITVQL